MVAGATAISIPASAAAYTNIVVLDNINVELSLLSQGPLVTTTTGKNEKLPAVTTKLTTSDLIEEVSLLTNGLTFAKSDKLVYETLYSNTLFGTAGTVVTNSTATITNGATNLFYTGSSSGTNGLPLLGTGVTNSYLITNAVIYQIVLNGTNLSTNTYDFLTNDTIYTSTNAGAAFLTTNIVNTNSIRNAYGANLGYWTTISLSGTNDAAISQFSPTTNYIYTNYSSQVAVLTSITGHGSNTVPTLIPVGNWLSIGGDSISVWNEAGTDLSATNDFAGTNINPGQIRYSIKSLSVDAAYTTNSAPAANTNIFLDSSSSAGAAKDTYTHINLTVGGTSKTATEFDSLSSGIFTPAGTGWIGGGYATNGYVTPIVQGGVTNTNTVFVTSYVGTNDNSATITNATSVIYSGSITFSFLMSYPQQ